MRWAPSLLAMMLCSAALAADLPACLPPGSVQANPESPQDGWLSRLGAADVRQHLGRVAGAGQWEGTTLFMMCGIQGPALRMKAADVSAAGRGVPAAGDRRSLSALAKRTGHTPQQADVLAGKYERLAGAFFRQVPDGQGGLIGEDELILRKHKDRAGVGEAADSQDEDAEMSEAQASALEARIEAAQQRGDLKEVLRLATQAQAQARPATERARQAGAKGEQGLWTALDSAWPELAQAAFRSVITFGNNPCLRCALPPPQGR